MEDFRMCTTVTYQFAKKQNQSAETEVAGQPADYPALMCYGRSSTAQIGGNGTAVMASPPSSAFLQQLNALKPPGIRIDGVAKSVSDWEGWLADSRSYIERQPRTELAMMAIGTMVPGPGAEEAVAAKIIGPAVKRVYEYMAPFFTRFRIGDWHTGEVSAEISSAAKGLAATLGEGLVPPPSHASLDLSKAMTSGKLTGTKLHSISYEPSLNHFFRANVDPDARMQFEIMALGGRGEYGTGTEIFLSGIKRLNNDGIKIKEIQADWSNGDFGANWRQFMNTYLAGETAEVAAKSTFTGRMAARIGLTEVDASNIQWDILAGDALKPVFKRPNVGWPENKSWQDYRDAYTLAHGRPGLEPGSTAGVEKHMHVGQTLEQTLSGFTPTQQQTILQRMQERGNHAENPLLGASDDPSR